MARKIKILTNEGLKSDNQKIDRRKLGYYYTPKFVGEYIALRMTSFHIGNRVLDPCCGKEELLSVFISNKMDIDGMDIIKYKEKYNCNFYNDNFIDYYCNRKKSNKLELNYDYYIANPPYNCHEVDFIKKNKSVLKPYFNDVGVHNMYSMFISAIIDFAKPNSVIGLITHDSFLTAKYHESLRKKIMAECAIHEITMCPTDLFLNQDADVRTSIIILQKGKENQGKIIVNNRPKNTEELRKILKSNLNKKYEKKYLLKDIVLQDLKDNSEFIIECPDDIRRLFNGKRLGDFYKCITGISTGNDKVYLSRDKKDPYTIPFYKNPGKDKFYTNKNIYLHKNFLKFDKEIKNFIVRNKDFLYEPGIICSSMGVDFTACKFPKNSTFGVNTNIICTENDSWWLLAYLNCKLVTYIVRGILIRSNMITSGYVSRIPMIKFSVKEKEQLSYLAKEAYYGVLNKKDIKNITDEIDSIVNKAAKISSKTINFIGLFKDDLIRNT